MHQPFQAVGFVTVDGRVQMALVPIPMALEALLMFVALGGLDVAVIDLLVRIWRLSVWLCMHRWRSYLEVIS